MAVLLQCIAAIVCFYHRNCVYIAHSFRRPLFLEIGSPVAHSGLRLSAWLRVTLSSLLSLPGKSCNAGVRCVPAGKVRSVQSNSDALYKV